MIMTIDPVFFRNLIVKIFSGLLSVLTLEEEILTIPPNY